MNLKKKAMCLVKRMDRITLKPRVSMGFSFFDAATGKRGGPKNVSFSFCTTLLRALCALAAVMAIWKSGRMLCGMKKTRACKRRYREKYKRCGKRKQNQRAFPLWRRMQKK